MKRIYFTVTNDLTYDQRMHRICGSLTRSGLSVVLVGRQLPTSLPLSQQPYTQKRLRCFFNKGFAFYAEYNLRLFIYLLTQNLDGICAIDLDTILPVLFISKIKGKTRIYDAHEYFTELKEVRTRPIVKKVWTVVEKFSVPKFEHGYTVSEGLRQQFKNKYRRDYLLIRNLPVLKTMNTETEREKFLVYQGAVNEARGFEYLIPAMRFIPYPLVVCGDGNFMPQLKELIRKNSVVEKVELKGMMLPEDLRLVAQKACLGIALAEKEGINQFHALPNKFLEFMHAGLPQVAMNFPEYKRINERFQIAVLLDELNVDAIIDTINKTMEDQALLQQMHNNAMTAREIYCWQAEEKLLIQFYKTLFP